MIDRNLEYGMTKYLLSLLHVFLILVEEDSSDDSFHICAYHHNTDAVAANFILFSSPVAHLLVYFDRYNEESYVANGTTIVLRGKFYYKSIVFLSPLLRLFNSNLHDL